jgi:hypothetical protein
MREESVKCVPRNRSHRPQRNHHTVKTEHARNERANARDIRALRKFSKRRTANDPRELWFGVGHRALDRITIASTLSAPRKTRMQHQVLHANPHTADRDDVTLWRQQKDDQRRVKLRGG